MRKLLELLLSEAATLPSLNPGPSLDVGDGVLSGSISGEVLARDAGVLAAQVNLENAEYAQGLILVAIDGVFDFLGSCVTEVMDLTYEVVGLGLEFNSGTWTQRQTLVGSTGTVPEELHEVVSSFTDFMSHLSKVIRSTEVLGFAQGRR